MQSRRITGYRESKAGTEKTRTLNSVSIFIVTATCAIFLLMASVIVYISYNNDITLTINAEASLLIDGDLVEYYARNLTVDEQYEAFAAKLDEMKRHTNAEYFYVLVDNGVPGMYAYIYDSEQDEDDPNRKYALGINEIKREFEGAEEVLLAGKAFDKARHYDGLYGEFSNAIKFSGPDTDIEVNREIIFELLGDTGLETDPASDGKNAVDMFMDGGAATRKIRGMDREDANTVRIVAMTANVMKEDVSEALEAGMNAHIGKPIDLDRLLQVLEESFRPK